jgi:fatty acid desaturase
MNDIPDSLLWLWIGLHVAPALVVIGRGIATAKPVGATAGLATFFAFVSLLAAGAGGILIYYFHSAVPTWVIGVVVNVLAFVQPFPKSQAARQGSDHAL